jgi:hypothetical protein
MALFEALELGLRRCEPLLQAAASAYLSFVIFRLPDPDHLEIIRIEGLLPFALFPSSLSPSNTAHCFVLVAIRIIIFVIDNEAFANL